MDNRRIIRNEINHIKYILNNARNQLNVVDEENYQKQLDLLRESAKQLNKKK